MPRLNCTARRCVNNEGGLCGAEYILIQGKAAKTTSQTYCSNFKENNIIGQIAALGNTNYIGEIKQMISDEYEIKMTPMIRCKAEKCFYNIDNKCKAADISIIGDNADEERETCCETFIE